MPLFNRMAAGRLKVPANISFEIIRGAALAGAAISIVSVVAAEAVRTPFFRETIGALFGHPGNTLVITSRNGNYRIDVRKHMSSEERDRILVQLRRTTHEIDDEPR